MRRTTSVQRLATAQLADVWLLGGSPVVAHERLHLHAAALHRVGQVPHVEQGGFPLRRRPLLVARPQQLPIERGERLVQHVLLGSEVESSSYLTCCLVQHARLGSKTRTWQEEDQPAGLWGVGGNSPAGPRLSAPHAPSWYLKEGPA